MSSTTSGLMVISQFHTPLGAMRVGACSEGLCLLSFDAQPLVDQEYATLRRRFKTDVRSGENQHTQQAKQEVAEYFDGRRQTFSLALHPFGTVFQQSVWNLLRSVPYAQTMSYQEQAVRLGKPKAVRAVASANGANPICIIIPCHRIIGKNGRLIGYSGGLERKQSLIEHERRQASCSKNPNS